MLKNYFIIAWRNLSKQKIYSSIKIGGFALGIAACLLIALFISDELSYDRDFPDGDRIYRVTLGVNVSGDFKEGADLQAPFASVLKNDFPEVEQTGRINPGELFGAGSNEIRRSDKNINSHEEGFAYADQGLLDVLNLPMVYGDPAHALDEPNTIVISKRMADKYFPNENPVGKTFTINNNLPFQVGTAVNNHFTKPYRIGGVVNFPERSHIQYDFLLTLSGIEFWKGEQQAWYAQNYYTYVKLRPGTDVAAFEEKLSGITKKYIIPQAIQYGFKDPDKFIDMYRFGLQPLSDIYLNSMGIADDLNHGDVRYIWLFGIIALFILVIASINFINLSTAKSANRAKEVGLRKTVGSNKRDLIGQFLTESVVYSMFSFVLGIILAGIFLPYFNILSAKSMVFPWAAWWWLTPLLIVSSMIIGVLAGLYPSFYLSSFQPIYALKGNLNGGSKRSALRSGLVIFQFTISIILITGTLIIYSQFGYILNKKLGFNKDQVLLLHGANTMGDRVASLKNELLELTDVQSVSIGDYLPVSGTKRNGNGFWKEGKMKTDQPVFGQFWKVDYDYIKTMGMHIIQGRDFSIDRPTDSDAVIINQTLAKKMGLSDPVGKRISNGNRRQPFTVIGVIDDFNYESLKQEIGGMCFALGNSPNIVSVKVNTSDISRAIHAVTAVWDRLSPSQPIRYTFLDENFARMYDDVQRMGSIFSSFALLAVIIACLGLFALSSFMIMQRTKEVGIRKVMGASVSNITFRLSGTFLGMVVVANIIAWPLAWYFMDKWLQDFAYRIDISWWVFILSGAIALLIALITVSSQSIKAALSNPAEALRYE